MTIAWTQRPLLPSTGGLVHLCTKTTITHVATGFPKKRHLGPQKGFGSLGPEKLLKIIRCDETEELKELMVGVQIK